MANHDPIMETFAAAVRAVAVAYPTIPTERIDDGIAVFLGTKTAVDATSVNASRKPYTVAEAIKLTGLTSQGLNYHARKGRIRRAYIPGSSRALGYVAEDIEAIVKGKAA